MEQKSIETFFKNYQVSDPDKKAKILPEVTDIIYDYNMAIVALEKEKDDYKINQLKEEIKELEQKIDEVFKDNL